MKKLFNLIVSVGSVDGVCTSAAALRTVCQPDTEIIFTQAFTVDKIDPTAWKPSRKVLFVDLAVNNRDEAMTVDFLRRIIAAGHQIVGVLDEHCREDWEQAFSEARLSFDDLLIEPVSQATGEIKSSGALLLYILGIVDEHTEELLGAADAGDRMDFTTHFGGLVNRAVKSKIADDSAGSTWRSTSPRTLSPTKPSLAGWPNTIRSWKITRRLSPAARTWGTTLSGLRQPIWPWI